MLIRADGAARGNPGPAAAGAVIIDVDSSADPYAPDAPPAAVIARALGIQTNNYAEYTAVALALDRAREMGAHEVELVLDSQLVVEQLAGRWKVKHPHIKPLVARAQELLAGFERWSIRHERRASNVAADALANLALDDPDAAAEAEAGARARAPTDGFDPLGRYVVGAACALFDRDGRILLVKHSYGRLNWELPGGAAKPAEPPLAAAVRELREETRIAGHGGRLTGVYFEAGYELGPILHLVFRLEPPAGAAPVAQPPEIDDLGWFATDKLPRPISDFTEQRIRDALSGDVVYRVIGERRWLS